MASPTLYHVPKTISSPIVQCLLELDLVDDPVNVEEMSFGDLKTDSYLAINPMGTSPAFMDDEEGIVMWESGAVLTYILERYDNDYQLHPPPTSVAGGDGGGGIDRKMLMRTRVKFLHIQQYLIATVYPFIASLFIHSLKPTEYQDRDYIDSAQDKWTALMGPALTKMLGEGPYFLGVEMTAIDFIAAKPLNNLNAMGLLESFPTLHQLFELIRNRPTFAQAYESLDTDKENPPTIATPTASIPNDRNIILIPKPKQRHSWN